MAFEIGIFLGLFLSVLVLPIILLFILKFIGPLKAKPGIIYGIPGVLAVLISFVPIETSWSMKFLLAVLMANIFFWGYRRAIRVKKAASLN